MSLHPTTALPVFADIKQAAERIAGVALRTPLLESPTLNAVVGGRILVKPEGIQPTGSFKLRGAVNRVAALTDDERVRGVVARSSGNHGQAIALAGSKAGISVTVVVPTTAPSVKVARIKAFGAQVVQVPMADLSAAAKEIEEREGRVLVPPADDFHVVAGAGTVGMEVFEQARELGTAVDILTTCCSGGGLTAGCLLARDELSPRTDVLAVEAEGFEKMARSLEADRQMDLQPGGTSICDAINGLFTAYIPFEIIRKTRLNVTAVSDSHALHAMRAAATEFGLMVEPGAAVGLASVLQGRVDVRDKTVVVVLSGSNVDPEIMCTALTSEVPAT